MTTNKHAKEPIELAVRLPKSLSSKALRSAVTLGLVYVARGRETTPIPEGPTTTYRIKLDATAQIYLPVASRICGGEREAICAALAWIESAPAWLRNQTQPLGENHHETETV